MNRLIVIVFLASCLYCLLGCKQNVDSFAITSLSVTPSRKIDQINDSVFLSMVMGIDESHGLIYISDFKNGRIVCVDSEFNLIRIFGSPGRGPSEIINPIGSKVHGNKLYAIDEGNERINVYLLSGEYLGDIKEVVPTTGRFVFVDSTFFGCNQVDVQKPIFKANIKGNELYRFGSNNRILKTVNAQTNRSYFIEKWKNQIIATCNNDPVIESYSLDGQLIEVLDLSNLKYFTPVIEYFRKRQIEDAKNGLKGNSVFFSSTYIDNNELFILMNGYDQSSDKFTCNHILVCNIEDKKMAPVKIIELKNDNGNDTYYTSFCVIDNKLIGFDAFTYEIHEFNLKQLQ